MKRTRLIKRARVYACRRMLVLIQRNARDHATRACVLRASSPRGWMLLHSHDRAALLHLHHQVFDLLYLNGESLLRQPLAKRRAALKRALAPVRDKLCFADGIDHTEDGDTAPIETALNDSVKVNVM